MLKTIADAKSIENMVANIKNHTVQFFFVIGLNFFKCIILTSCLDYDANLQWIAK